jgi:predicted RNase H-like HicB family nuclease
MTAPTPGIRIEPTRTGFSAYSPDLPGCIATGETEEAVRERMAVAIRLHLRGLAQAGRRGA